MITYLKKNRKLKVLIVEDNTIFSAELSRFLEEKPEIEAVKTVGSIEGFMEFNAFLTVDVILLDIGLPGIDGISGIVPIKMRFPSVDIIMLTTFSDNDSIFQSLCAGAVGYVLKDTNPEMIKEAIIMVSQDQSFMSPSIARKVMNHFFASKAYNDVLTVREQQVVLGIVDGLSYKLIASRLDVKMSTVQTYIKNIYRKLDVHSRTEVINKVKQ